MLPRRWARRRRHPRRARRHEHQRRLRLDPPRRAAAGGRGRAAPTSGLAFDGDADRVLAVDDDGDLVDGDHSSPCCALDLRDRGRLHRRHRRRHGDDQPRASAWPWPSAGINVRRDPGRRPLRARGAGGGRLVARRRAVGPRDLPRPGHHRRRPAHRPAAARRRAPHRPPAGRAGRRCDDPPAPGAAQRAGRHAATASTRPPTCGRRGAPPSRPSWATTAGCSCAQRHRAAGAGHGRGADRRAGRRPRPTSWPRRSSRTGATA